MEIAFMTIIVLILLFQMFSLKYIYKACSDKSNYYLFKKNLFGIIIDSLRLIWALLFFCYILTQLFETRNTSFVITNIVFLLATSIMIILTLCFLISDTQRLLEMLKSEDDLLRQTLVDYDKSLDTLRYISTLVNNAIDKTSKQYANTNDNAHHNDKERIEE